MIEHVECEEEIQTLDIEENSEISEASSKSTELLADGLLENFAPDLKRMQSHLSDLIIKQNIVYQELLRLKDFQFDENLLEVSLMMKKMAIYRVKIKRLNSSLLYIHKRVQQLKKKAIEMQEFKVNQKADRVRRYDWEMSLIARAKK
ncbi:unnamed protein product [Diamesa serratosioi]